MKDRIASLNPMTVGMYVLMAALLILMVLLPDSAALANEGTLGQFAEDARAEGEGFYEFVRWPMAYGALGLLIVLLIFARDKQALIGVTIGVFAGAAIGGEIIDWGMGLFS